ncbi:MAG: HTH-type transcriptional regulator, partial [Nocardioidaceae bacterium]|nr:HTH-type transcriptional regulator [Nocardioidaceae bacterium]
MSAEAEVKTLRRDAAENRQRLLDAASQVFAEHGLDGSVDEVARVAGVGMGTLYRRFPTKEALIGELVRQLLEELVALARQSLTVADGCGLEQYLFELAAAQNTQRGCLAKLWNDDESVAIKNECHDLIGELLIDAQAHQRIRADANLSDIDILLWSLPGVIATAKDSGDAAWRRHVAIFLAGLRPTEVPLNEPALTLDQANAIRLRRLGR